MLYGIGWKIRAVCHAASGSVTANSSLAAFVRPQTVGDKTVELKRALPQRGGGGGASSGAVLSAVDAAAAAALGGGAERFSAFADRWRERVGQALVNRMEEQGKGHLRAGPQYGPGFLQLLRFTRNVVEHPPPVDAALAGGDAAAAAAANATDRQRAEFHLGLLVQALPELPLAVHAALRHLQGEAGGEPAAAARGGVRNRAATSIR